MSTYVVPQVEVFQDFSIIPAAAANPLRSHISGGHAQLQRYAQPTEKEAGDLGYYDNVVDTDYAWPARPAGGIVDDSYVKLFIQDALLLYFTDTIDEGSVITKTPSVNNQVRSATISFAQNGDYPRSGVLLDRNVVPGDIAKVRGITTDSESIILWTYVKSVIGDVVASVLNNATVDANNATTQAASHSWFQVAGPENCVNLTPDHSEYEGLADGSIIETYDIVVVQGSGAGDFTTATLRIISGSGLDDQTSLTPEPVGVATPIGTRGLTVTFGQSSSGGCSSSAASSDVSPDDMIAGQRWRVTVHQAFTEVTATASGTYTGIGDTTYIVKVTRGGFYTDAFPPIINVTTVNGVDISGPTPITAASTAYAVGTLGVSISFNQVGLNAGDTYYIEVEAASVGPMRTIELGHNLDTAIPDGSQVDLTLFILKPFIQVTQDRDGFAPLLNWDTSETQFTVKSGIVAQDPTWTEDGEPQYLDVWSESTQGYGKLFVETRYWLNTLSNSVQTLAAGDDIDTAIPGATDPDNPLKWGVLQAQQNSNGTEIKFTSIADPDDPDSWAFCLGLLLGRDDVYHLVPLTRDRTVLDLYAAQVSAMSSPEEGLWRVLWTNLEGLPEVPLVSAGSTIPGHITATTTDGQVCLAVVEDDPQTSGTQYTIVRSTTANANFIKNGVVAGDVVRLLFTGDGFGNFTYTETVIDEVQSEDQLRLLTDLGGPISVASKIEVWRYLNADQEAQAIALNAGSWGSRRIRATWPDQIESSGTVMEGYFMNCALAGLCSGVLPHQGLTHLEIVGYTSVERTTSKFNRNQLDVLASGGTWIVTQDMTGLETSLGEIFTRHAVTTGDSNDINQREEMVTRNVDSISFRFQDEFKPFIGVLNVTPVVQAMLLTTVQNLILTLQTESATTDLGGQLIGATIVSLRPSLIDLDRYVLQLQLQIPYPFNVFEIHLSI